MPRHKDIDWNLPEGTNNDSSSRIHSWESIHTALLMDIRDELKALNQAFQCYRMRRLYDVLCRIDQRLQRNGLLIRTRSGRRKRRQF